MKKTIAVIGGTGDEGPGLALRWAASGKYRVVIGSREPAKAQRVASEINAKLGQDLVRGLANEAAVVAADIAVLLVPYRAHKPTLTGLRDVLAGKILIDATVPLQPPKVSHVHVPEGGSAGQEAQAILGDDVQVVCAFQNVGAPSLADYEQAIDCDVLVCGNSKAAKAEALALAEAAGMRGIDAGPLQNAVVVEGLSSILIGINIRHHVKRAGIKITGI